jgi:hypothetical protein
MAKLSKRKVKDLFEAEVMTFMVLDGWCGQSLQHAKLGQAALGKSAAVLGELSKRLSQAETKDLTDKVIAGVTEALGGQHEKPSAD